MSNGFKSNPHVVPSAAQYQTFFRCGCFLSLLLLSACAQLGGSGARSGDSTAVDINPESHQLLLRTGDDAYARDDLDTAQLKYALAVNQSPDDVSALFKLATVHYQKNSLKVAREVFFQVIARDDQHAGAMEMLGLIAIRGEDLEQAEQRLSRALELQPNRWRALNALGIVKDMQSDHAAAQESFNKALLLVPDNVKVENNLGYSFYLQGEYSQAMMRFMAATRKDPQYSKAWSNLGLSLVRQQRYDEARAAFGKIVDQHVAANNIGYLGMLQGDYNQAEAELSASLQLAPSWYGIANENLKLLNQRVRDQQLYPTAVPVAVRTGGNDPGAFASVLTQEDAFGEQLGNPALAVVQGAVRTQTVTSLQQAPLTPKRPAASQRKKQNPRQNTSGDRLLLAEKLRFLGYAKAQNRLAAAPTRAALRSFQVSHGLNGTGAANRVTREWINRKLVERLHGFLGSLGYKPGEDTSELDSKTREAIQAYENDRGLKPDGLLDGKLLRVLGAEFLTN